MKNLFIVVGAAGVGKSDIVKYCLERHNFHYIKKFTTRKRRLEELNSEGDLIFSDMESFDKENKDDIFSYIYGGERYWIRKEEVQKSVLEYENNIIIFSDFNVVKNFKKEFFFDIDNIIILFIYAESGLLHERLLALGYSQEQITYRLRRSSQLWEQYVDFGNTLIDYTIINNQDKNVLFKLLDNIIKKYI